MLPPQKAVAYSGPTLLVLAAEPIFIAGDPPVPEEAPPAEPDSLVSLPTALELLNSGEYDRACEALEELGKSAGDARAAVFGLARCRLETGKYQEALDGLWAAKAEDSADGNYLLAVLHGRLGRYDEVVRLARAAIEMDKNHAAARLLHAETLEAVGRRDEAIDAYQWFDRQLVGRRDLPKNAEWITHTALGFLRYSVLTQTQVVDRTKHVLNEMLQSAYSRVDRSYWPARIAAADLLRDRFNNDDEHGSLSDYRAALRINPRLPEAQVGLGVVALANWNFEEVEKRADLALGVNSRFAPAFHLLAGKFIVERRYEQAGEAAEKALAVNPNDTTALSLRAAAASCRFDDAAVDRLRLQVERINPYPAVFHRTVGDALSGIRQYAASERAFLKAIELDPVDANSRTELGMMYMQWGEEEKARAALEAAFRLDPYNERTKFTLDLLESLEKFTRHETANFIIKYDAQKDPGFGEFVGEYLESIYESVTRDYSTPLSEKTIIEIFPSAAAFGVRITGRPWIPTVGACSGRVIAFTTPRLGDDRIGPFNMARVLKHEFTHTVTLAATRNRIPHWFTEGLAVYQEDSPRNFLWSEMLADAVRRERLFTLQTIDWGFMRPKRPNDRQMAYAQSEWMCEFIVERFGYDVIQQMLNRYHDGRTQPQVLKEVLHIEPEDFDREFRVWARGQASRWPFELAPAEDVSALRDRASADTADANTWGRLARAEWDADDPERALAAAAKALGLDENNADGLAVVCHLRAAQTRNESSESARRSLEEELIPFLKRWADLAPKSWHPAKYLSEIFLHRKDRDAAVEPLQRLQALCPLDPTSWSGLAGIYLERGQDDLALPQLLELAAQEEHDATIAIKISDIYRRKSRLREAQHWLRQAIFIDPFNSRVHESYAEVSMQIGETAKALQSYRMLTQLEPKQAKHFDNAAFAAHKLGNSEAAERFARRAVELDPESNARSLLP